MTKQELVTKIEERKDLADRAYNTYQQLQGQIALLRDMLKEETDKEKQGVEKNPRVKQDKGIIIPEVKPA